MSEKFLASLATESNYTETENGGVALKSTGNCLVDLFGSIGAIRGRDENTILRMFIKAFNEDALLATKMSFHARNIRGGLGERDVSRVIWRFLADQHPEIVRKNLVFFALFGRWDDLYIFMGTSVEGDVWDLFKAQLTMDIGNMNEGKPVSLLAKWLKSVNTSSDVSNKLGKMTARKVGMNERMYRKTLSSLRAYLDVTEVKMASKRWSEIAYGSVPSRAMSIYSDAFKKRDQYRFEKYMEKVASGEEKINAGTLYPYDILEKGCKGYNGFNIGGFTSDNVIEELWKALPNYVEGENNMLVMADTSGSMRGRPMATSVGLAIYFAERNKGVYENKFMTFSERPSFVTLTGNTLYKKVHEIPEIVQNTNIEAALMLILNSAVAGNIAQDEMPKALIIISDMQFDSCEDSWGRSAKKKTVYGVVAQRFIDDGYEMPNIVFWNVNSNSDVFQVSGDTKYVQLASGQSVAIFKSVLSGVGKTPYEMMVETLSDPMYECITV